MRIYFASVIKPHGIKGEVEVNFSEEKTLTLGIMLYTEDEKVYKVDGIKKKKSSLVLKLSGIDTLENAEKIRGIRFYVSMEDLPKLDEDSFYIAELIGLSIVGEDGSIKGIVKDTYATKAHTVIVVEREDKMGFVDIPFVKRYIGNIDKEKKEAVVFDFEWFLGN